MGTIKLLTAAARARVRRFVYAESSSAYGDQPVPVKNEQLMPMPLSPYAAAKLAGEYFCQAYSQSMGLEAVGLRYFNVFGPRQDPKSQYSAVIPLFIAETPIPKVKSGECREQRSGIGKLNNPAQRRASCPWLQQ